MIHAQKNRLFTLALSLITALSAQEILAQDYARWGLPDDAVARLGRGAIEGFAFTPNGRQLVISSGVGLWYYDIASGEPVALEAEGMPPEGGDGAPAIAVFQAMRWMSFEPGLDLHAQDGSTLASAVGDTIRIRDILTGEIQFEERLQEPIRALAYSADPFTLAAASGRDIVVWRGLEEGGVHESTLRGHTDQVRALRILPGGSTLASADISRAEEDPSYFDSGEIRLWDLEAGRSVGARTLAFSDPSCCLDRGNMIFSPDGSILAAGGFETVFLWDTATGQPRAQLEDPDRSANVVAIAFSPNGRTVGVRWRDEPRYIRLWDVSSGVFRDIGSAEHLALAPVGISADGTMLGTSSEWETSFSYDGSRTWNGEQAEVQFWDTRTGRRYFSVSFGVGSWAGGLGAPLVSPDFKTVASHWSEVELGGFSIDGVSLHDIQTGERLTLSHDNGVNAVAFSPDGRILASWMYAENAVGEVFDKTIQLWDVATGALLLAASEEEVVSLADPETGEPIATVSNGRVSFAGVAPPPLVAAPGVYTTPEGDTVWLSSDREVEATSLGGAIILRRVPFDTPRDPELAAIIDAAVPDQDESLSAETVAADLMAAAGGAAVTTTAGDAGRTSETTVENPDRAALVALYEATDGPNWSNNDGWLTDAPLADWAGVRTDNSDRVTDLRLSQFRLSGPIPPEIGNLSNLTTLSLSGNRVSGPIPPEIGNLSNLRSLWLLGTDLSGPIPPEIGNLANLEELLLGGEISGRLPPELGDLASLTSLWLDDSDVSGQIPSELGDLANLTLLRLVGTDLSGPLPPELGNLASLTNLELANNALSGRLPPELGDLANLTNLEAPNNAFSGPLPPELGNLASLTDLELQGNELSGPIPSELGGLANLGTLWFNDNELSGPIPSELGDLANLNNLWLANNDLSGPLPPELGDLANLTNLDLQENDLSGPVPSSFLQLTRLNALRLSGNSLCIPKTSAYTAWLRGIGRNDADMLSACDAVDPVPGEQSTVDRATQLEEAAQGADQVLANDDAPPVVGITWFAEHLNEGNLLERWQIILEGDSAGSFKGTLHHWLIDGGESTDGWDAGPVTGTYSYPDVALSWSMEAFIVTLSCELAGIMAPAGDAIHGTVACVPDIIGNREITIQLRFDRTYG